MGLKRFNVVIEATDSMAIAELYQVIEEGFETTQWEYEVTAITKEDGPILTWDKEKK